MKFFYAGRLGHTILTLPLYGLRMIVTHSPPKDPWLSGESLREIIKRIALLEARDVAEVTEEVRNIRSSVDNQINTSITQETTPVSHYIPPIPYHGARWVDPDYH